MKTITSTNLYTIYKKNEKEFTSFKDLFTQEYKVEICLETKEKNTRRMILKNVRNTKHKITFLFIENKLIPALVQISGKKYIIIEDSIKIINNLVEVLIPDHLVEVVTEFLQELIRTYMLNLPKYMSGTYGEVTVKLDIPQILERCYREYINYLKHKNIKKKAAIYLLKKKHKFRKKINHTHKTYTKIYELIGENECIKK